MEYPDCKKCNDGLLLPLSDYGRDGAAIRYKAWVCHNPDCGFSIRIDTVKSIWEKFCEKP